MVDGSLWLGGLCGKVDIGVLDADSAGALSDGVGLRLGLGGAAEDLIDIAGVGMAGNLIKA